MADSILRHSHENQISHEQAFREAVFLAALPALIACHGSNVYDLYDDDVADVTNSAWNFANTALKQRAEYLAGDGEPNHHEDT